MSLTADNVIRVGRGSASTSSTSTAIAVTLDASGSTDADSVVFVGLFGEGLTFATPSGWAVVQASSNGVSVFRRGPVEGLAAGESSWNFTPSATAGKAVTAGALEVTVVDPTTTVDVVGTVLTGTSGIDFDPRSGLVTTYDGLAIGVVGHRDNADATPATWNFPLYFSEVLEQGQAGTGNSVAIAFGVQSVQAIGDYRADTEPSRTLTVGAPAAGVVFVVNAIGARHQSDLFLIDGAEHGTITGNTLGPAGKKILSTATAGVTVSTAAARSGVYGWQFTSTAAACNWVSEGIGAATTGKAPVYRRCFNLNGNGIQRRFWRITMTTTGPATVNCDIWILTSGLLACIIGSTQVDSDQTVPSTGWFAVEVRFDCSGHVAGVSSTRTADWTVDYDATLTDVTPGVPQGLVSATSTVAGAVSTFSETLGWASAVTAGMYSDDGGAAPGHNYPLGDLRVLPLKVDPAGTPTCTTSTNFGVMTANGSVAAWNATNFRNAVDDVPPDLSGTRDAAVAIAASATDTADIPMATYDLAANKVVPRGVRFGPVSIWAASGTVTTIRIFVYDGTTLHTIYAEADPSADNAATPVWITGVVKTGSAPILWTQAVVDALAVRFGSNDGNPDIGLDTALLELAVVKAVPEDLFGESGAPVYVEAHRDPATQALVGATVTTDADNAVELTWEVDGVPDSSGSIPPSTSAQYVPLSADGGIETVNTVSLIPG